MKLEGQVRIPSGCAIAAVISRDGNRMTGESITNAMKPMHDRSNGLGGGFAGYGIYPEYRDFYALHLFFDSRETRKSCEQFLKEYFEIVQAEIIPTRKIPAITDEPLIWRYFVAPLKSVLASQQLDEKEFVARTVMKINTEMKGLMSFPAARIWERSRQSVFRRMSVCSISLRNTKAIPGRRTADTRPIPPDGGAVRIRSRCWILIDNDPAAFLPPVLEAMEYLHAMRFSLEYYGYVFGDASDRVCEIVFNPSMTGYQEILSDPSYTDQAVVMTYPLIGNYGMAEDDYETKIPSIGALIVREYNDEPSNFRSTASLSEIMQQFRIPGIYGIDTRKLTRSIRDHGSRRVLITDEVYAVISSAQFGQYHRWMSTA